MGTSLVGSQLNMDKREGLVMCGCAAGLTSQPQFWGSIVTPPPHSTTTTLRKKGSVVARHCFDIPRDFTR